MSGHKIINILFNVVLLFYISSLFETNNIIDFSELQHIAQNHTIESIYIEKNKNYALIDYTNITDNNSYEDFKLEFPNIEIFFRNIDTYIDPSIKGSIIYFNEYKISYGYILFTLVLVSSFLRNKNKGWTNSLVTNLDNLIKTESKVKFNNIAGMQEIKQDIKEYIDFIKNKKKYIEMGARLPKGVLLAGPPGCGKTLIAKAIAGETDINLYAISASDFNEIFVGVGAKRIQELFQLARDNSPSIIFIDELDSIGCKRGVQFNREYDNVLNKILVEMDGFNVNEDIMVFGATNRVSDLDPALLRSGRFDRKIIVDYPNKNERCEIVEYYFKDKSISEEIKDKKLYYKELSRLMSGLSGADIENIANHSTIRAVKNNRTFIDDDDIKEALDEIMIGIKKKERIMTDKEKKIVAYHEIGHALIAYLLKETTPPLKISIIPRGENILGFSQQEPEDKKLYTKGELLNKICVLLGGRLTEELFFGGKNLEGVTNGAYDDIEKITNILHKIYYEYGMIDEKLNYTNKKFVSDVLLEKLNRGMDKLLKSLENKTYTILEKHKDQITKLAEQLMEDEILYCNNLEKIIGLDNKNSIE